MLLSSEAAPAAPPAPEHDSAVLATLEETARFFEVSLPTVRSWIAGDCPVVRKGANGVAYQLDLRAVQAWRQARADAEATAAAERADAHKQLRLELLGADALTNDDAGLTPRQIADVIAGEAHRTKLAIARRDYVPAKNVQIEMELAFKLISSQLRALPDLIGRRLGLPDDQVDLMLEQIDTYLDDLADKLHAAPPADSQQDAA